MAKYCTYLKKTKQKYHNLFILRAHAALQTKKKKKIAPISLTRQIFQY